jgi:preprotein translocase subunit secB
MEPVLQFEGYQIEKIIYEKNIETSDENNINVEVSTGLNSERDKGKVELSIHVLESNENRKLEISLVGFFTFLNVNDDKKTEILAINGTAILYPYIRSVASMVTSQDSSPAIILPTVNTINFFKNKTSNEEN